MEKFKEYMLDEAIPVKKVVKPVEKNAPTNKKKTGASAPKTDAHQKMIKKVKDDGFEHAANDVWVHKSSGKKGRITDDGKWEPIVDKAPKNKTTGSNNTEKTDTSNKTVDKGVGELGKIDAMVDLSPEEKVKKMRTMLAGKPYSQLSDEIKETYRAQARKITNIMMDFLKKKTEIEKILPPRIATHWNDAQKYVKGKKDKNNLGADIMNETYEQTKAVGTVVSMLNELGAGEILMDSIHGSKSLLKKGSKYEIDIQKAKSMLIDKFKKTVAGKVIDADGKLEEGCESSAYVAQRQIIKLHSFLNDNKLDIKKCETSFFWQDDKSTATLIAFIENEKIEKINGVPAKQYINDSLLKGTRDGNATDTLITIRDKKTNELHIQHISNKKSNTDKIGTSTPPAFIDKIKSLFNKNNKDIDINDITNNTTNKIKKIDDERLELEKDINFPYSEKAINVIKELSRGNPDKYYDVLIKKFYGKDADPNDYKKDKKKEKEFYDKILADATSEKSILDSKLKGRVLTSLIKEFDPDRKTKINHTYQRMMETFNEYIDKLNKKEKGHGDQLSSITACHILHTDGRGFVGIESKNIEMCLGLNESSVRFHKESGKPCVRSDGKYYIANEDGTPTNKEINKKDYDKQGCATVINDEILSKVFDKKIPPALKDDFFKNIKVEKFTYKGDSNLGNANVYTYIGAPPKGKKVEIGYMSFQKKQGGKSELAFKYRDDFLSKAVVATHHMNKKQLNELQGGKEQNASKLTDFLNTNKELIHETVNNPKLVKTLLS